MIFLRIKEKKMSTFDAYKKFEAREFIDMETMLLVKDYIALQLNSPGFNYKYYYDMYSYAAKCQIVLQKFQKTRFGQAICNGELVDFIEDEKHKNCICSSVFYNAVL